MPEFGQFDPYEWEIRYFFGSCEREVANALLKDEDIGTFLLRESKSRPGGLSLSIREADNGDHQIYHYFIERKETKDSKIRYEMCGVSFVNIPFLINYYKTNILEKSPLLKPLEKPIICQVIGRYRFDGERTTDLPFERGEMLEVIAKPEEQWWLARNCLRTVGLIPVPYVKLVETDNNRFKNTIIRENGSPIHGESVTNRFSTSSANSDPGIRHLYEPSDNPDIKISVPAWVRIAGDRSPSIYDTESLALKQGQLVLLTEILPNSVCRGIVDSNGKSGLIPFSYVEFTNISLNSGPWNHNIQ